MLCVALWPAASAAEVALKPLQDVVITERGLEDRANHVVVLDLEDLERSLGIAAEYFTIKRRLGVASGCAGIDAGAFSVELSRAGRIFACLSLASDGPGSIDGIAFVGPLADAAGAEAGRLLTDARGYDPLKACLYPEGMLVCPAAYSQRVRYMIDGCESSINYESFEERKGAVPVCYIEALAEVGTSAEGETASVPDTSLPSTFSVRTERGRAAEIAILDYGLIVSSSRRFVGDKGTDTDDKAIRDYNVTYEVVPALRVPARKGSVIGFQFKLPPIRRGDSLILHYQITRPHRVAGGAIEPEIVDAPWVFDHRYSGATRTVFTEFSGPEPDYVGEWQARIVVNDTTLAARKFMLFEP